MKQLLLTVIATLLIQFNFGQSVGIGTTNPDASAKLDISSTTQGILLPRMTMMQRLAVVSPSVGLVVYQLDSISGVYVYLQNGWSLLNSSQIILTTNGTSGAASLVGNTLNIPQYNNGAPCNSHFIGENYGGGIVFFVYDNGQHGLISSIQDLDSVGTAPPWYNGNYIETNAIRNDGILAGRLNTDVIISKQGNGRYAASVCAQYLGGGFSDWYLPSKYELNLLYLQKNIVGGFPSGAGAAVYFSSTEGNSTQVWRQDFENGDQFLGPKNVTDGLRAIRAF